MKTVLIVEDEKLIRQGIRTMVQRSGVPIEVIMECNNGEAALEILKDQKVDVMFTDIRMPKMDGLELVREVQKLSHKPQIVAVSGYDDFAYAVELLRHGVREYILKPVEREKITAILKTLEEEYEQKRKQAQADHQIGKNQIRYLLMNENPDDKEVQLLEQKYEERFFPGGYQVCVAGKGFQMEERENTLYLDELGDGNVCICTPDLAWIVQKNELWQECAGMSMVHKGLRELKTAYREAFEARKRAFYRGQNVVDYGLARSSIPEGIRKESLKQVSEQVWTQRLHLVGTGKTEELGNLWKVLFAELKKERILPEEFEAGITLFLNELEKIYRNLVDEETHQKIEECHNICTHSIVIVWTEKYHSITIFDSWDDLCGDGTAIDAGVPLGKVEAGSIRAPAAILNGPILQGDLTKRKRRGQFLQDLSTDPNGVGAPVVRRMDHQKPWPCKSRWRKGQYTLRQFSHTAEVCGFPTYSKTLS